MLLPSLVSSFFLTLAVSFLIGIGLREYYEGEGKYDTFGTARTFVFIGMLGFVLYQLSEIGATAFLVGFGALTLFLLVYYSSKVMQKKSPGLIGVMVALTTYATGPIAIRQPSWYLVLLGVSILFVVHSKGRIRKFTDRLETGEIVTVCKFLAIVGVVLPLIPDASQAQGWAGRLLAILPVTPRQIWMAVVITTAISYLGYVFQTYLYPNKGLLLTGVIGGIYSSTVTVVVLSKKSKTNPGLFHEAAVAILLAVAMMFLRLLALVAIFRFRAVIIIGPAFLVLAGLAGLFAFGLRQRELPGNGIAVKESESDVTQEPELRRNPLEINSAILFAVMFTLVSLATKYVLELTSAAGLRVLSFVVGLSDITPFVVSLLQGSFGIDDRQIVQAILIATASNNLLKLAYTYIFGSRRTANLAAPGMVGLAIPAILYALFGL